MEEKHSGRNESKEIFYSDLERSARENIRVHLTDLVELEETEWCGGKKPSARTRVRIALVSRWLWLSTIDDELGAERVAAAVRDLGERVESEGPKTSYSQMTTAREH